MHLAPISELMLDDVPLPATKDLRVRNKSARVAALDMRYQRYKKAEP